MWGKGLKIHRATSWLITLFALITILLGYAAMRHWFPEYEFFLLLHGITGWILPVLLLVHLIFSIMYLKLNIRRIIAGFKNKRTSGTNFLRLLQRITKWGIIILGTLIGLSGLSYYPWFFAIFGNFFDFSLHIDYDIILSIFMIVHVGIGARFYLTRKKIKQRGVNSSLFFLVLFLSITTIVIDLPPGLGNPEINIGGEIYNFNPDEVETARPDLFQDGSFSVFDILLHLDSKGEISLNYHLNTSMDTYVIDSINGNTDNWWYYIHYSGGHLEKNVVRIDHYPWKPGSDIRLYHETESYINAAFLLFTEEVSRYNYNNNSIIIPVVTIIGYSFNLIFSNLTVNASNLRSETFQNGVITAMDVLMTLGELGEITFELRWVGRMGSASYVHSYFVSKINSDQNSGRCGFLYSVSDSFIFLSADERILTSPESVSFFWGCL